MRPLRNIFYKLSRTEQRREGVAAYLWYIHTKYKGDGWSLEDLRNAGPYFLNRDRLKYNYAIYTR